MSRYTESDKICSHCEGEINGHCCGDRIIRWCDVCGSNDKDSPPSITVDFHEAEK